MIRLICMVAVVFVLCVQAFAADKVVRDRNGRLVETWSGGSGSVTVRDRNGTLSETRTRHGNNIVVRDKNGRLLRTEEVSR